MTVRVLRQIRSTLWLIGFVVAASPAAGGWGADAQAVTIPREHHAWARFTPGSWSKVRKWTEELDEQGKVKSASTTETKTTLIGIDESGCTLQVEVTVEVAGKRFVAQPRQVRVGFDGGTNGARTEFRKAGEASLDLGGKAISCAILESTLTNADTRVVSRLHYSDSVPPFILRREIVTTSADGKQILEQTTMDAVAVEMPQKVLTELLSAIACSDGAKTAELVHVHPGGRLLWMFPAASLHTRPRTWIRPASWCAAARWNCSITE